MKKTYYLFNPGRLSRKDNTLKFIPFDDAGNELKALIVPEWNLKFFQQRNAKYGNGWPRCCK